MIERYVYAVVHRLPSQQRADIEKELRGLIEDMLEERAEDGKSADENIEAVLTELGNPSELAAKYRGYPRYLISPELFEPYWIVLKVVGFSILFGMSAVFVLQTVFEPVSFSKLIGSYIANLILTQMQGFAWVTAGFAIAEFVGVKREQLKLPSARWTPATLPPVPDKKSQIPLSEPIAAIAVLSIVFLFFIGSDWSLIPFWVDGGSAKVSLFNAAAIDGYMPWIIGMFALWIIREATKIIKRKWTKGLILAHVAISFVSFAMMWVVFADGSVWNPNFLNEWVQAGILTEGSEGYQTISSIWEHVQTWFLLWLVVGLIIDLVATLANIRKIRL